MYYYKHTLWLADEEASKTVDFGKPELQSAIEEAVEYYNEISGKARNPKKILSYKINEKQIELNSESSALLARPNLALQVFSRYLAQGKMKDLVTRKALFRGTAAEAEPPTDESKESSKECTDEELLLKIVKIFFRKGSEDRRKIELFRSIVFDEY